VAEHRHRTDQPRRLAQELLGVPPPARLLGAARAAARELRQVPPGPRPPAEGDLRGEQARRRRSRPEGPHEPRREGVGPRRRRFAGADLRHLPHVGQPAQRRQGDPRSG
jgi:hypothetical protein